MSFVDKVGRVIYTLNMTKQLEQLKNIFGLSTYEAKLYLAALKFDNVSISDMSRFSKIPRTACYKPVEKLVKEAFLSPIKVKKRTYYRAISPRHLKYMLERKQVELNDMVSNLEKQISAPERKLAISYFDGLEGVSTGCSILFDEARSKKGKSWEDIDRTALQSGQHHLDESIRKRLKQGIFGEMITTSDLKDGYIDKLLSKDKEQLRKSILVSSKKYPFKSSIAVIDDMTLIITSGENPFAILIRNKDIATTMWSIHEMYWDRYKK